MPDPSSTSSPFHTYCVFIVPAVKAPVGGVINHHGTVSPLVKLVCVGARGCVCGAVLGVFIQTLLSPVLALVCSLLITW